MSKLKELLAELCPNGVEYVKIGDICEVSRGRVMSKDYLKENVGEYSVYSSQTENDGELGKIATYDFDGEYLTWTTDGANAGTVFYRRGKFSVTNVCGLLKVKQKDIITKYLYYTLSVEAPKYVNKGMGNPKLMSNVMSKVKVKIPPIEIQQEIVRILDSFTSLTAELQTKLQAELQARQKQYEYYRDRLLTFDVHGEGISEVQWKTLGEVSDIISGFPFDSSQFTESGIRLMRGMNVKRGKLDFSESNNRYWSSYDGLEKYLLDTNDIVIAMDGSLVGKSFGVVTKPQLPLLLVQRVARIRVTGANSRYVYHCVVNSFSSYVDSKKTEGAVPHISLKDISKFKIPTPPITIQNRIAEVLDNFDAICSDLNIGLPAEIEARQKQYEYYRDALLSFNCSHSVNVERAE